MSTKGQFRNRIDCKRCDYPHEMALEWVKSHLGEDAFNAIPRMSPELYDREPNFGPYSALTEEDMTHTVMMLESSDTFEFLAIVVKKGDHKWFDYNGEVSREDLVPVLWKEEGDRVGILVYLFIGDCVAMCRHGRALFSGPFTLLLEQLPIQPDSDPLMMPLHNFLCGRFVPEPI